MSDRTRYNPSKHGVRYIPPHRRRGPGWGPKHGPRKPGEPGYSPPKKPKKHGPPKPRKPKHIPKPPKYGPRKRPPAAPPKQGPAGPKPSVPSVPNGGLGLPGAAAGMARAIAPRLARRALGHIGLAIDLAEWAFPPAHKPAGYEMEKYGFTHRFGAEFHCGQFPHTHVRVAAGSISLPLFECLPGQVPTNYPTQHYGTPLNVTSGGPRYVCFGPGNELPRMTFAEGWDRPGRTPPWPNPVPFVPGVAVPLPSADPEAEPAPYPFPQVDPLTRPGTAVPQPAPMPWPVIPGRGPNPNRDPLEQSGSGYSPYIPGRAPQPIAEPQAPAVPSGPPGIPGGPPTPPVVIPVNPSGPPRPGLPPPVRPHPAPPGEKQKKFYDNGSKAVRGLLGAAAGLLDATTETADFVTSLYNALPKGKQSCGKASTNKLVCMTNAVWNNMDAVDWTKAALNVAANQAEDAAVGKGIHAPASKLGKDTGIGGYRLKTGLRF